MSLELRYFACSLGSVAKAPIDSALFMPYIARRGEQFQECKTANANSSIVERDAMKVLIIQMARITLNSRQDAYLAD
jgi:hypothetical protein